ncbi:putative F-box/FBD/LRR-repeat protein At5g22670 [Trifolium pratense]|uniref:putative F-box/FBD/LRR-repeat protein At5g22670 n=1 Tax=Trifolium pratense TaxID=57577 RepID=UPI001E69295A|nr:putative F-box/FBD/LRR-repeat protein At5g22670 [Trifolium pratense]
MSSSHKNKRMKKSSLDRITLQPQDLILCQILLDLRSSIISADIISDLPDPILCHILSFLSTKQAATTSILSKRWKSVWLSVLSLDFDDQAFKVYDSFRRFVYTTMFTLRDKNVSIHSFNFKSGRSSQFTQKQYHRIFKMVMQYGLKNLNFNMSNKLGTTKLPPRIFGFKMLQVLKLTNIQMGDFDKVDFPHLKTLHLNIVWFKNHEYIVKFLFGCPILENFKSCLYFNNHSRHHVLKDSGILPNLVEVRISGVNTPMVLVCKAKILHMEYV